jgi:hypothetical protein
MRAASPARNRRGSTIMETVLYLPVLAMLLWGMVELARITYTYYTLQKILYTLARLVGTQQGVNFCDSGDEQVKAAKNFALTGSSDGSTDSLVPNLTIDEIAIRIERYNNDSGEMQECDCSITGCDAAAGGGSPDYLVVYLTGGYSVRPVIPFMSFTAFALRPMVRVPYGGT